MDESSPKILHHVDAPASWTSLSRALVIRGWGFSTNGDALLGVRVRIGPRTFSGAIGIPRPDVRAAFPHAPGDNVGFEVTVILPDSRGLLVAEAQLSDGSWHVLFSKTVQSRRRWRPSWLSLDSVTEGVLLQTPTFAQYLPQPLDSDTFPSSKTSQASWPRFAIVTPSFEQASYLPRTLDSVLGQSGVRGEYFIQDGGSKDGSVEILKELSSTTVSPPSSLNVAWESIRDGGQADATACGFAKTTGGPDDIMGWLNSDDFYQPGALTFVADYFAAHPKVDVVYGHRLLVDENSQEIGRWFLPEHDPEVLRLNDFVPQETLFWRRRIWDKVGGLDRSYQFAMDWDLLLRFQEAGARIVRLPYFLACFRIHPAQKTSAAIRTIGQREIDSLRERTFKRPFPPAELETHPRLLRYLRRSAWIKFLWNRGIRAR